MAYIIDGNGKRISKKELDVLFAEYKKRKK